MINMEEFEKRMFIQNIETNQKIERNKFDNEILYAIKKDLEINDFDKLYTLNPKFIYEYYTKLWKMVFQSNCSHEEKMKALNFLNDEHRKFRVQNNGYEM